MTVPVASIPILLIIAGLDIVGCSSQYPKFENGDQVLVTYGDVKAIGTVLQCAFGKDRDFPDDPYYRIYLGPLENGHNELNIAWMHAKYLKKVSTSQKKTKRGKEECLKNESKD
jgi:hypothetical protein